MNNLLLHQGFHPQSLHTVSQPSHHSLSRAVSANEGLTARITGPGTSSNFLAAVSGRTSTSTPSGAPAGASSSTPRQGPTDSTHTSGQANAAPIPRSLTIHEQDMISQLDKLKYFLATAPSRWSSPNSSASDALVQHPQTASHPAMNRFLLPSGEFVSCVLWGGLYHITGTDIVRALVFRFDAFARPVRNMKKFEEGVFSDLRNLKPGNDACLEEPKSPFLDLLFKYQCIRTQKKQKVFYWFSVPHDRLFLDALERDLKREKMGLEPTTVVVGEPARSFTYDPKRTLYEQFASSRGGEGDELDRAVREAEHVTGPQSYASSNGVEGTMNTLVSQPTISSVPAAHKTDTEDPASEIEATPEPSARSGTQAAGHPLSNQSGHGKQFFNMLSLFEGSPSYKQRRKKVPKPPRRRIGSGGNGTESESEAGVGLRFPDEDLGAGAVSGLDIPPSISLLQEQIHRGHGIVEHSNPRAHSLAHAPPTRQSPYAQELSSHAVAVPTVSLRQHQPEATNGLNGTADTMLSAPHVSSSLRSEISQQLTNQQMPQIAQQQYVPAQYSSPAPPVPTDPRDISQSIAQMPNMYAPTPAQSSPSQTPCTKAYVCPLYSCGRLYREPWYLKEHIRSHTVEKPYQCDLCYKQFSQTDNLTQHRQTHVRADAGDPQALLDLERVDEEETMLMGEKICEVEVRGEVEDVAGEPGQLRGLGVVCIYPSNGEGASASNLVDDYPEVSSPPPSQFPYPGMTPKHSPNGPINQWRGHHGRSVPPVGRWPSDLEQSWDVPRSQSALGYNWDQRSVSPAYSAISAPISHTPYHRPPNDPMRASIGYMQSAPSHKQSFDGPGLFPAHSPSGALRRHRSATPFQSHRNIPAALRRTSAGGPDEADLAGATSRYHPYGHTPSSVGMYSSPSPASYPAGGDHRATSGLSNNIDTIPPEASYAMNHSAFPAVPNSGYYAGEQDAYGYDVGDVMYEGSTYDSSQTQAHA